MPRHTNFSHFFITVNSQEDLSNNPERLDFFKKGCEYMFFQQIGEYFKFNESRTTDTGKVSKYILEPIEVDLTFEHGNEKCRDHCHVTINVVHNTKLLIDQAGMRGFFNNMMGHKIHLNIRPGTNQQKSLESYLNKQGTSEKRLVSVN